MKNLYRLPILVFLIFLLTSEVLAFENQSLVEIAKKYEGTIFSKEKIECKGFVQKIVREAGGKLGPGYRYCFLDIGKEIIADEATLGDIIQLDNPNINHNEKIDRKGGFVAYTYPMHTALVLENHKDGTYKVIDCNRIGRYKVGIDDWSPYKQAGNKLHVHFYRLGTVSSKPWDDKTEIEVLSKQFTEAWYTYDSQMDKNYLQKIKPYMTNNFYEGTYYVNTNRPKDFKGQVPLRTKVISVDIIFCSANNAETKVKRECFEPTTNRKYQRITRLKLIKDKDKWFVDYIY